MPFRTPSTSLPLSQPSDPAASGGATESGSLAPPQVQLTTIHENLYRGFGQVSYVKPPIYIDYGTNLHIGSTTFINRNCHILDAPVASIAIGERCLFGPNVHLYCVTHTLDAAKRTDPSYEASSLAGDILIGDDCWIGGNTTILPGVTIGDGSVIGAGSVVTRDIPAHHLALGVPARVVRKLDRCEKMAGEPCSRRLQAAQLS